MKSVDCIDDIPRHRPIHIYGAGRAGRLLRRLLDEAGGFNVRGYVQTMTAGDAAGVITLEELARTSGPKSVVIASQWMFEIDTLLQISGVPDSTVFSAWNICIQRIQEEDREEERKKTFEYNFRVYGGFDLLPPRQADFVLVGDSFAYHLGWEKFLDPIRCADRSVPGISVSDVERLLPYCLALTPKAIFLLVGWVDLTQRSYGVFPKLLDEMRSACASIARHGVEPIVLSLIPMAPAIAQATREKSSIEYFNRCVAHFNREMAAWCAANGAGFLDAAAPLREAGNLRTEFAARDGAHVNRRAARVIIDGVRAFLEGHSG